MPKSPEEIRIWVGRIQRAKDLQEDKSKELRTSAIQMFTGTFFGNATDRARDMEEVNFLFEFVKVSIAAYYARHPKIFVRTNTSKYQPFVETLERVLEYDVRDLQIKDKAKTTLLDSILQPPGWGKIGFTRLAPQGKLNGKLESQLGILDETRRNERVFFSNVPSWRMLWPDGYNNQREAPYLIEQEPVTLEDLLRNPAYKNKVKNMLQETGVGVPGQRTKLFKFKDNVQLASAGGRGGPTQDPETVKKMLHHVWDRRNRERFTLVEGFSSDTLFEMDWNWVNEGFSHHPLILNPVPEMKDNANSYPMSDVQAMMPQLRQLSEFSSAMIRHGRRAAAMILTREGELTDSQKANIAKASDIDLVELPNISETAIKTFQTPSMPGDWYRLRPQILQDLMRISGFQQLLQQSQGIDTATESENLQAGERLRVGERQDVNEEWIKNVMRGIAVLRWQFTPREKIAEILGEEVSEEMWPTFPVDGNGDPTPEAYRIAQEEIKYELEAGSMRPPKDEAVDRKQWENFVTILKTQFPNRFKELPLLQQWLKKYDFKDIDLTLIGDDEEEIAAATEESRLMAQGIPQVVSPNENHDIHIAVHSEASKQEGPTAEEDEHIAQHGVFRERKQPLASPQQGDTRIPQSSQQREGVTGFADLVGSVAPNQRGLGVNTSRR